MTAPATRDRLLSIEELHAELEPTERLRLQPFTVGESVRFEADPTWQHGITAREGQDAIGVYATVKHPDGDIRVQLTRSALNEVCGNFGFRKDYVTDCPPDLLVPHMNYWYRAGLFNRPRKATDYQFVLDGDRAVAFTKQGGSTFSTVALIDQAVASIRERYGRVEVLADYKLAHSLRQSTIRLVIPDTGCTITGSGTDDDQWSLGVQIKNSLTGQSQTSFEGYLFRWASTSGAIDTTVTSGVWTRRKDATEDEITTWARQSVSGVLGGLDGSLAAVQRLTNVGIEGSLTDTLRDIFEHYRIALPLRPKVISYLERYDGEITMYVVMNAITQAANEPDLEPAAVESLMRHGGDLTRTAENRCGACHRMYHQH